MRDTPKIRVVNYVNGLSFQLSLTLGKCHKGVLFLCLQRTARVKMCKCFMLYPQIKVCQLSSHVRLVFGNYKKENNSLTRLGKLCDGLVPVFLLPVFFPFPSFSLSPSPPSLMMALKNTLQDWYTKSIKPCVTVKIFFHEQRGDPRGPWHILFK